MVEIAGVTRFVEKRHVDDGKRISAGELERAQARCDSTINGGVDDRFEVAARGRVGEYYRGQLAAIHCPVGPKHVPEPGSDRERRLRPGRFHTVRELVGVEAWNSAAAKFAEDVALACCDPACESDLQHNLDGQARLVGQAGQAEPGRTRPALPALPALSIFIPPCRACPACPVCASSLRPREP